MTDFEPDRIERALEALRKDTAGVREALAALTAQFEMWKFADRRTQEELYAIREKMASHVDVAELRSRVDVLDTKRAELGVDVRRLWWGVGICMTALIGTIIKMVLGVL